MTDSRQRPETPRFEVDDEIDLLFGRANPNPIREGCLPVDGLKALARRERSMEEPGFEHLAQCSPCYREFRGFQQANARAEAASKRNRYRWAAVLAVVVLGGAAWAWLHRSADGGGASAVTVVSLDLRPFSVTRGAEQPPEPRPLVLPRGRVNATILLPIGAEPGDYEIRIVDDGESGLAASTGAAALKEQVTTLDAAIDTAAVRPGVYRLAVRKVGNEWQMFPAKVE